jgi:hypothetical protein
VLERGKQNRPALGFSIRRNNMARGLGVVAAVLMGCSGLSRVVKSPPQPLELTTVFVYPVALTGMEPNRGRVFELSQRTLDRAVNETGDRLVFFGPTEFKIIKPEVENAWVASDAIPVLVQSGSRPDQGAVLRVAVERRLTSSSTQAESLKGQPRATSSNEETTWVVRTEVLHPSSSTTLIEVSGQVTVDPFAVPPPEAEWDPAPQLTKLVDATVSAAMRHLASHAASRPVGPAASIVGAATPASIRWFGAADENAESLQGEVTRQNRARLFAPTATDLQVAALAKGVAGTAVLKGDGKLEPGDVVLSVDGVPALPHVLARVRFKGASAELEVKRVTGAMEHVIWP